MRFPTGWTRSLMVGLVGLSMATGLGKQPRSAAAQNPGMGGQQPGLGQQSQMGQNPGIGQNPTLGQNSPGSNGHGVLNGVDMPGGMSAEKRLELQNEDRQKHLVADTTRLLELATQLHTDVNKTDQHILSIDVVRRADEIERLAHSVKERMKG